VHPILNPFPVFKHQARQQRDPPDWRVSLCLSPAEAGTRPVRLPPVPENADRRLRLSHTPDSVNRPDTSRC
jgi:hypothetical protein